ncbi:MAG: hypothetical protein HYS17_05315 [Micavibrio aeruginosavorus]|uniref:Uncharacterized protein n=1 Tax=Micavibrio aeruginosavorus TaxID=349221 RepID=A0A7T5R466_9BACT|nr:MAG: hypothetical protein HYS17_05315 [Micavibrio aeruginosavorus]
MPIAIASTYSRVHVINDMYYKGTARSTDILRADFDGCWPPADLNIGTPPDAEVIFETHNQPFSDSAAHVSNQERDFVIHLNRMASLSTIFRRHSRVRADSISHENIHVLQKQMIHQGLTDVFGRFLRHGVKGMVKRKAPKTAQYYCAEDEIQVRLHLLVSSYFRDHRKIPLNQHELWSLLHHEGVRLHERCVESLYQSPQGLKALGKFFREKRPWFVRAGVSDLNQALANIDPQQREKFCRIAFPALYGSLLELYGDREGSRRMGYGHNIILTDLFFRQAWRIGHHLDNNREHLTAEPLAKIKDIIAAMPEEQKQDMTQIVIAGRYIHPLSGHPLTLPPATVALLTPCLPPLSAQCVDITKKFQSGGQPSDFQLE